MFFPCCFIWPHSELRILFHVPLLFSNQEHIEYERIIYRRNDRRTVLLYTPLFLQSAVPYFNGRTGTVYRHQMPHAEEGKVQYRIILTAWKQSLPKSRQLPEALQQ